MPSHCLHSQLGASQVCRQAQVSFCGRAKGPSGHLAARHDVCVTDACFADISTPQHLLTANDCSQASQTVQQHVTELADLSVQQQVKGTTQYLRPQLQAE
jgi:hypothetical protein